MIRSKGQSRLLRIMLAAALLPAATGAGAQAIGRLFNTPAERGQLDSVRNAAPPAGAQTAVPTPPGIAPPGANQPIPYPGAGASQQAPAAGPGQQVPYPGAGAGQQAPYPGAGQPVPYPGAGQAVPYPGANQAGNQPVPYPSGNAGANPGDPPPPPPPPESLVMNGVLRTSNGRSTVWLNDVPQSGRQMKVVQRAHSAPQLTVQLPSGKKVLLKPGQRYDLAEGRVKDINEP
jgi:hypothetical protein